MHVYKKNMHKIPHFPDRDAIFSETHATDLGNRSIGKSSLRAASYHPGISARVKAMLPARMFIGLEKKMRIIIIFAWVEI